MAKTPIEIDQEALATAAEVLGTKTKKDTVNEALREVGQRLVRLRALARLGEKADRGDFDEFACNQAAYRPVTPPPSPLINNVRAVQNLPAGMAESLGRAASGGRHRGLPDYALKR